MSATPNSAGAEWATYLSLQVLVGIPVRVEDDDGVSRLQVESQAASPSRQQKDEVLGIGGVEHFQHVGSVIRLGHTVQTHELEACVEIRSSETPQIRWRQYSTFESLNLIMY